MKDLLLTHKRYALILIPMGLLVIMIFLDALNKPAQPKSPPSPSIAPTIAQTNQEGIVRYNKDAVSKLRETMRSNQALLPQQQTAKQNLIARANQLATIHQTEAYRIQYIRSSDIFMIEITTSDIGSAKKSSSEWLSSQGFDTTSQCTLPVVYYINSRIAKQLRSLKITFNPLPEECI